MNLPNSFHNLTFGDFLNQSLEHGHLQAFFSFFLKAIQAFKRDWSVGLSIRERDGTQVQ